MPSESSPRFVHEPPSGGKARAFTLLGAFWIWLLLPAAVHYQRKARREVLESDGYYTWSNSLLNRPILLWLVVLTAGLVLVVAMAALGTYGDPAPSN